MIKQCEICGINYLVTPCREKLNRFCSKKCRGAWQSKMMSGKNSPNYKDGKGKLKQETHREARRIAKQHYKWECMDCGINENILKAKKMRGLLVHHIDENEYHNHYKNLMVLCNSCHRKLHNPLRKQYECNCIECGNEFKSIFKKYQKYCSSKCSSKYRWRMLKNNPQLYEKYLKKRKREIVK